MKTESLVDRRRFLGLTGMALLAYIRLALAGEHRTMAHPTPDLARRVTLFLCGDVMTGRGIDQILPHPGSPRLYEPFMRSAIGYVELAEAENGPIRRPVAFPYIWGDALEAFARVQPDKRIVNLETAVTTSDSPWPDKDIHYRMHPANVPCLTAGGVDCCVLANNHVMDWGVDGLLETLASLHDAGIRTAGAGRNSNEAAAPAVLEVPGKGRVLVFAWGMPSSGVPEDWAALDHRPGVNLLPDLSVVRLDAIARMVRAVKKTGDVVVASLHWGGNWGYEVSQAERNFAHGLVDAAGVDVVHGHSSHHVKGIEVYRDRPILYGCGDFLNDYEGIGGHEDYRGDLALMYFPSLDAIDGHLQRFVLTPTQTRRLRVNAAPEEGRRWLMATLNREGGAFGTRVVRISEKDLLLQWH